MGRPFPLSLRDQDHDLILPLLKTNLVDIAEHCINGNIGDLEIEYNDGAAVTIVLASGGYPESYRTGHPITGLEDVDNDVLVFHAGTHRPNGELVTSGGRVLNVVGVGPTYTDAIEKARTNVRKIYFKEMHYRDDIGAKYAKPDV